MPRWMRIIRGMIGTGVTFAAVVGVATSLVGIAALIFGKPGVREVAETVGQFSFAAFLVGLAFSGALALTARGKTFDRLSLPYVTALGVGGGLLYFLVLALTGGRVWTAEVAMINFGFLTVVGGGAAAATLLLARRAGRALRAGDAAAGELSEGDVEERVATRAPGDKVSR